MEFKVLSYNIHKGRSLSQKYILEGIKSSLTKTKADMVFLQEVEGEKQINHQLEFLADKLWPHYAYGKNAIKQNTHHGNAFLSKFPIISWQNIDLSLSSLERRSVLYSKVKVPPLDLEIHCLCVHLSLLAKDREVQIKKINKFIKTLPATDPLIVAGDFNDWSQNSVKGLYKMGLKESFFSVKGEFAKTFPSFFPVLPLDRIYFKNLSVKSVKTLSGKPWSNLSDHLALLTTFEIKK